MVHPMMYFNADTKVTALLWTSKEKLLVGTSCGSVQLWHSKSQKLVGKKQIFEPDKPILWMALKESRIIVQARFSEKLKIMEHSDKLETLEEIELSKSAVNFCHGDIFLNFLALPIGENQCEIIEDNTKKKEIIEPPNEKSGFLGCIKVTSKFTFLGYENGQLRMIEKSGLNPIFNIDLKNKPLLCMDMKNDYICVGTAEDCIFSVKIHTDSMEIIKKRDLPTKGISSLKIRSDGKILICGSWDSTVRLFSFKKPENLKPLGALKFHQNSIDCLAVNNDTGIFAAGSSDGYISIWNVYNE